MFETQVGMKDGEQISGMIRHFEPEEGWFSILDHFGNERVVAFSEVYSAVTPASRVAFGCVTDRDELRRAAEELFEARRLGYVGEAQEWELEALR